MLYGLILVLFAAVLNVAILLFPLWLLSIAAWWLVDLLQKLHWMGRPGAYTVYLLLFWFETIMVTCFQMIMWGLASHAEPGRWTLAVAAFGCGRAAILLYRYKHATSTAQRRFQSWTAAMSCIALATLCFAAFSNTHVHAFLAVLPVYVFQFLLGGVT